MPRGCHLSAELRELLYHHLVTKNESPQTVFRDVIGYNDTFVSLKTLKNLKTQMNHMTGDEVSIYLQGPGTRRNAGRKRIYDEAVRTEIVNLRLTSKFVKLRSIASQYKYFYLDMYNDVASPVPSASTISRILAKNDVVRKVVERRNIHANPALQEEFLQLMRPLDAHCFIDIDETLCNDAQFEQKYGWARRGDECVGVQISIGGHNFSVIAAYSNLGFLCWSIYQDSVSTLEFIHFVRENMVGMVREGELVLLDNASVHKTEAAHAALEEVCEGRFMYAPPYSPHLKPIELGFSNIKGYLREREAEAVLDPIGAINAAFSYYALGGAGAGAANGNWKVYRDNHLLFTADNNANGNA